MQERIAGVHTNTLFLILHDHRICDIFHHSYSPRTKISRQFLLKIIEENKETRP